jgi:uncharacterized protein
VDGPHSGTSRGVLAALAAALLLTVAALAAPTAVNRPVSIAGTAFPAETAISSPPPPPSTAPVAPQHTTGRYQLKLEDHPLLVDAIPLPRATCELPQFGRDEAKLRAYYLRLRDCLDTAWRAALAAADMPWSTPSLNLDNHPGEAFCGNFDEADFTAAYCPDSEMIFLPVNRLTKVDRGGSAVHLGVFAHEYAHHIQASVGILEAAYHREDKVGRDSPQGQELSRRTELQADCFAGLFLAAAAGRDSISRQLAESAINSFRYGALAKTHGLGSRQHAWARRGYEGRTTAACNTWSATPAEVG